MKGLVRNLLTGYATTPGRVSVLNAVDRGVAFFAYYYVASLCQINPLAGVAIGLAVEAGVIYLALKALERRGISITEG